MGRRKIVIQPLRDDRNRIVTFHKRKQGLFKKAHELSVLCCADVAVIVFSNRNDQTYDFCNSNVMEFIHRYQQHTGGQEHKYPRDFDEAEFDKGDEEGEAEDRDPDESVNSHHGPPPHPFDRSNPAAPWSHSQQMPNQGLRAFPTSVSSSFNNAYANNSNNHPQQQQHQQPHPNMHPQIDPRSQRAYNNVYPPNLPPQVGPNFFPGHHVPQNYMVHPAPAQPANNYHRPSTTPLPSQPYREGDRNGFVNGIPVVDEGPMRMDQNRNMALPAGVPFDPSLDIHREKRLAMGYRDQGHGEDDANNARHSKSESNAQQNFIAHNYQGGNRGTNRHPGENWNQNADGSYTHVPPEYAGHGPENGQYERFNGPDDPHSQSGEPGKPEPPYNWNGEMFYDTLRGPRYYSPANSASVADADATPAFPAENKAVAEAPAEKEEKPEA